MTSLGKGLLTFRFSDLRSVPGTYTRVEEENWLHRVVLWPSDSWDVLMSIPHHIYSLSLKLFFLKRIHIPSTYHFQLCCPDSQITFHYIINSKSVVLLPKLSLCVGEAPQAHSLHPLLETHVLIWRPITKGVCHLTYTKHHKTPQNTQLIKVDQPF